MLLQNNAYQLSKLDGLRTCELGTFAGHTKVWLKKHVEIFLTNQKWNDSLIFLPKWAASFCRFNDWTTSRIDGIEIWLMLMCGHVVHMSTTMTKIDEKFSSWTLQPFGNQMCYFYLILGNKTTKFDVRTYPEETLNVEFQTFGVVKRSKHVTTRCLRFRDRKKYAFCHRTSLTLLLNWFFQKNILLLMKRLTN